MRQRKSSAEGKIKGKPPVWFIEISEAPAKAVPLLRKLKFTYERDMWRLPCWDERWYTRALKAVTEAGCHGRGYNVEAEATQAKLIIDRARQQKEQRLKAMGAARRAEFKRQEIKRRSSEALARACAVLRNGRT